MEDYPQIKSETVTVSVKIAQNSEPYFEKSLPKNITVDFSGDSPVGQVFALGKIIDDESDAF